LIIFDLDDTLIDTSGTLGQIKLKDAYQAMVKAGLDRGELDRLKEIDAESHSGKEAISRFLAEVEGDEKYFEIGKSEYYGYGMGVISCVRRFPGVNAMLRKLSQEHDLAMVTYYFDSEEQQKQKITVAGIEEKLFKRVVVTSIPDKGQCYIDLMQEWGFNPAETVVCGDRIGDLQPAKDLGITTIHMQQGRGRILNSNDWNYSVKAVADVYEVICGLCKR
jgi:FMN phosphatase YigB (HAD superfamily)